MIGSWSMRMMKSMEVEAFMSGCGVDVDMDVNSCK
jgi:hypothetical protein